MIFFLPATEYININIIFEFFDKHHFYNGQSFCEGNMTKTYKMSWKILFIMANV